MTRDIHSIILAAGRAKRFGRAKLLADFNGVPLLHRSLNAARSAFGDNTWLVTGHSVETIEEAAGALAGHVIHNSQYAQGIGSSIACGARACSTRADAVVIMLADQPLVTSTHLEKLAATWTGNADAMIATEFSGVLGPPVLFGRDYFAELCALRGDAGAKQILETYADAVTSVRCELAAVDIDTPADLERLVRGR